MGTDNTKKTIFGLSQFDTLVITIVAVLVVVVIAVSYWSSPSRLGAMVAYLYPASDDVPNIWLAPVNNPADAQQLTFSAMGIYDFTVDGRGQTIAYSMRDEINRTRDIYLLDLVSGNERQLTFCADADAECYTPAFHPTDSVIAYIRVEQNTSNQGFGTGAPRIWVLDYVAGTNQPLANDSQLIGHSPIWSDNGNTIAYYSADLSNPGVMVYNFNPQLNDTQTLNFVPSNHGSVGTLSPNGQRLIVPDIVNRGEQVFTYLKLVDFTEEPATLTNFSDPNSPIDDIAVAWHPNGDSVTIARRFTDDRWTRGYQLFEADAETGEVTTLLFDESYGHFFFSWDNLGEKLVMQRLPLLDETGAVNNLARPEIWVLNYETGELIEIVESAYFPRWVIPQ